MKKGLSTIVTTLLILLLIFVAIGVIWIVVKKVIIEGTEQVSLGKFTLDLEISQVQTIDNDTIKVKVKRNSGEGEFIALNFIFNDGDNSEVIKINTSMKEFEEIPFYLNLVEVNLSDLEKIEIAPVFKLESGKEVVGLVKDEYIVPRGVSECEANCPVDAECGSNGCGDVCGTCSDPTPNCVNYQCSAETCTPDCSEKECGSDGCEDDCGTCNLDYATAICSNYQCEISSCNSGYANCDSNTANGCEIQLGTNSNCASCGDDCDDSDPCTTDGCDVECLNILECSEDGQCCSACSDDPDCVVPPVCGNGTCDSPDEICGDTNIAPECNDDCGSCEDIFNIYFSQNFEDDTLGTYDYNEYKEDWNYPAWENFQVPPQIIENIDSEQGTKVMRYIFPEGGLGPSEGGGQWMTLLDEPQDEIYFSYRIKFRPGFEWVLGGKIPGVKSGPEWAGFGPPPWDNGFIALLMWKPDHIVFYYYHHDRTSDYGETEYWDYIIESGEWYTITIRVVMNTVDASGGNNDGILEGFIDGELVGQVTGVRLRNLESLKVDTLMVTSFFGGGTEDWASIRNEWIEVDDFYVFDYNANANVVRGNNINSPGAIIPLP